ncbi:MAG: AMP-binding protein [Myxococcota bacterium]|nr:AMP-binding protein [Myxococcota bacterium]
MAEPSAAYFQLVAALLSMNLVELIREPVRRVPERTALRVAGQEMTYGQVGEAVERCAAHLCQRGVGPGDSVALLDDCSPLLLAAILGAARIGAAAVPIHVELQLEELAEVLRGSDCGSLGIAGEPYREKLSAALGRPALGVGDLLDTRPELETPAVCGDLDQLCVKLLTSGTTGLPKPIGFSHRTFTPRMSGFAGAFDADAPYARSLLCVPGVHIGGLGGLLVGLAGGNTLVIMQRFKAGEWLQQVERQRINMVFLVPTMLRRILDHPDFDATDLSSLRAVSYGAAAAPVEMVEEMIRRFPDGVAFSNVYGQTETTGAITSFGPRDHVLDDAGHLRRAGSVGKLVPGVEHRLVDPESQRDVPPGEVGELWVRSAFNAVAGWNRTGDLIRIDEQGYLYPVGRLSDTINRGGEKFGPVEIESALRRHPGVADVAVAGIADPELGERVGAAIVRVPGRDLTRNELIDHCRKHLARFKLPEQIVFVREIPHTALWKVSRKRIAELIVGAHDPSA